MGFYACARYTTAVRCFENAVWATVFLTVRGSGMGRREKGNPTVCRVFHYVPQKNGTQARCRPLSKARLKKQRGFQRATAGARSARDQLNLLLLWIPLY